VEAEEDKQAADKLPGLLREGVQELIRKEKNGPRYKIQAFIRDARNHRRIRIICRLEEEVELVKGAAERVKPETARVLRDQLYPVKLDSLPLPPK
jgi:hypothetical protein